MQLSAEVLRVLCISAAALFLICAAAAAVSSKAGTNRKRIAVPAAAVALLSLAVVIYTGGSLIFADKDIDEPVETATPSPAAPTPSAEDVSPAPPSPDVTVQNEDTRLSFTDMIIDEAIEIMNDIRQDDMSSVSFPYEWKYERDSLSDENKAMYDEMLQNVRDFKYFAYTADEHGHDVMGKSIAMFGALTDDYLELGNYFFMYEVVDDEGATTAIESLYFMPGDGDLNPADTDEVRKETQHFDEVCKRIIERMPDGLSAYDKYRYLAVVISLVSSYDYEYDDGWQTGMPYGSIVSGYAICEGYSLGFLYLCQLADLWCAKAEGIAGEDGAHMWNMVKLDTGTYYVDITWCDELGYPGTPGWSEYFMLTQEQLVIDHTITDDSAATGTHVYARNP